MAKKMPDANVYARPAQSETNRAYISRVQMADAKASNAAIEARLAQMKADSQKRTGLAGQSRERDDFTPMPYGDLAKRSLGGLPWPAETVVKRDGRPVPRPNPPSGRAKPVSNQGYHQPVRRGR